MGSATSKQKQVPTNSQPKSPQRGKNDAVTNVNNTPVKSPSNVKENAKPHETPTKNNILRLSDNDRERDDSHKKTKVSKKEKWNSDSDLEDDLDKFIQETVSTAAAANIDEPPSRPRTSHGRSGRSQNSYPETYAQKHTREQYTVDRDMLIRQKTIYRNPDEWNYDSDDDMDLHQGFDASKFRQVNIHKEPVPVSNFQKDLETPRYIKSQEDRRESSYGIYDKERNQGALDRRLSRMPTYDVEEQQWMDDLENEF